MQKRIIPPFRFGYVEKDVLRGGHPISLNFDFLRTLHLKTMISMIPNPVDENLKKFCDDENITHHYYQIPEYAGQIAITSSQITEIISLMCNSNNLPVYIHSVGGGHTTGLVVMCLRKLQRWSTRAMFTEFNQYVADSLESCEEEFLHSFNSTFELPPPRPAWIGHLSGEIPHPTLRVIFPDEADSDSEVSYEMYSENDENDE